MENLICIKTYTDKTDAELAKGLLETNGIEAIISADDCGGMQPHLTFGVTGVRLLVNKEDTQRALEILEES